MREEWMTPLSPDKRNQRGEIATLTVVPHRLSDRLTRRLRLRRVILTGIGHRQLLFAPLNLSEPF